MIAGLFDVLLFQQTFAFRESQSNDVGVRLLKFGIKIIISPRLKSEQEENE